MDAFLEASSARRRDLCEQAAERLGLQAASVEKDYWICWTLRELFALPESGPHLTFKGGTSLSKRGVWKRDYDAMREALIFGEAPPFEEILAAVGEFQRDFNVTETGER